MPPRPRETSPPSRWTAVPPSRDSAAASIRDSTIGAAIRIDGLPRGACLGSAWVLFRVAVTSQGGAIYAANASIPAEDRAGAPASYVAQAKASLFTTPSEMARMIAGSANSST